MAIDQDFINEIMRNGDSTLALQLFENEISSRLTGYEPELSNAQAIQLIRHFPTLLNENIHLDQGIETMTLRQALPLADMHSVLVASQSHAVRQSHAVFRSY